MHVASLVKSLDIYSSYRPETKICLGQTTPSKFAYYQSQTISLQYQCTNQVWWKSIDVNSSYHPETKYGQTDVRLTNGRTHGRPTWNHNTRHYGVAGYKIKRLWTRGSCWKSASSTYPVDFFIISSHYYYEKNENIRFMLKLMTII